MSRRLSEKQEKGRKYRGLSVRLLEKDAEDVMAAADKAGLSISAFCAKILTTAIKFDKALVDSQVLDVVKRSFVEMITDSLTSLNDGIKNEKNAKL